ncbi:MAG: hypothetical protein GY793_00765 [Proteobacteria bacterium]|nr:hypothetical protein [Pseudomonadota bacterium]
MDLLKDYRIDSLKAEEGELPAFNPTPDMIIRLENYRYTAAVKEAIDILEKSGFWSWDTIRRAKEILITAKEESKKQKDDKPDREKKPPHDTKEIFNSKEESKKQKDDKLDREKKLSTETKEKKKEELYDKDIDIDKVDYGKNESPNS